MNHLKTIFFVAVLSAFFAGCGNNYIEWRRYDAITGNKIAEYKAGRQSLFVNSTWDIGSIILDPNHVSADIGGVLADPEKMKIYTGYGIFESGQ